MPARGSSTTGRTACGTRSRPRCRHPVRFTPWGWAIPSYWVRKLTSSGLSTLRVRRQLDELGTRHARRRGPLPEQNRYVQSLLDLSVAALPSDLLSPASCRCALPQDVPGDGQVDRAALVPRLRASVQPPLCAAVCPEYRRCVYCVPKPGAYSARAVEAPDVTFRRLTRTRPPSAAHLNTSFAHFLFFVDEVRHCCLLTPSAVLTFPASQFKLVEKKELAPLAELNASILSR